MPAIEPATAQVVAMLADHKLRLRVLFMSDGHICPDEQAILDGIRQGIMPVAEDADEGRKLAIRWLDRGSIRADTDGRTVREFGRDHDVAVVDLEEWRQQQMADDIA